MISDVLSEAVQEIDRYMDEMPETYATDIEIHALRDWMERVRVRLDTPPETERHPLGNWRW